MPTSTEKAMNEKRLQQCTVTRTRSSHMQRVSIQDLSLGVAMFLHKVCRSRRRGGAGRSHDRTHTQKTPLSALGPKMSSQALSPAASQRDTPTYSLRSGGSDMSMRLLRRCCLYIARWLRCAADTERYNSDYKQWRASRCVNASGTQSYQTTRAKPVALGWHSFVRQTTRRSPLRP